MKRLFIASIVAICSFGSTIVFGKSLTDAQIQEINNRILNMAENKKFDDAKLKKLKRVLNDFELSLLYEHQRKFLESHRNELLKIAKEIDDYTPPKVGKGGSSDFSIDRINIDSTPYRRLTFSFQQYIQNINAEDKEADKEIRLLEKGLLISLNRHIDSVWRENTEKKRRMGKESN